MQDITNMQNIPGISDLSKNDTKCLRLLDLPDELCSSGILNLPKNAEHSWFPDLPEDMIYEIFLAVPPINYFRLSKVCHKFKKLLYAKRKIITNGNEYLQAMEHGDILSLFNCSIKFDYGLYRACVKGHLEIIQLLKRDTTTIINSALHGACYGGHMDMVQLLIKQGAKDWNQGLYGACQTDNINIVELMITNGADNWNSCLCVAAQSGQIKIVELLMTKETNWSHAFLAACNRGHMDIVQLFINKCNGNFSSLNDPWNEGLVKACKGGHVNVVELMIQYGANNWNEGFYSACKGKYPDVMQLMQDNGANECRCNKSIEEHN